MVACEGHILSHLAWEGRLAELSLSPDAASMVQHCNTYEKPDNLAPSGIKRFRLSIECPPEIFARLKARRGKQVDPTDGDVGAFCCEQYPDASPLGLIYAPHVDFSNPPLDDWLEFEYWCEDIHSLALSALFPELPDEEITTPLQFFSSKDDLKQKLLKVIAENDEDLMYGCVGVDIACGSETLELVYTDLMDWAFEYGSVLVVASGDGLTEDLGFYCEP